MEDAVASPPQKRDRSISTAGAPPSEPPETAAPREPAAPSTPAAVDSPLADPLIRRHLAFGWWALAIFAALGLLLETAHGLKLGWYLDVSNATRRLSFTLGHAHGALLGLVNVAFALSLPHARMSAATSLRASFALRAATVLMPLGFLLGGIVFYAGDPGFGVVLVPPSGALLVIGLVMVARGVSARP